jgi:hypothetical protein
MQTGVTCQSKDIVWEGICEEAMSLLCHWDSSPQNFDKLLVPSRKRNHKTHRATPWNQPLPPSQVGPTSSAQNLKLPLHYTPMYGWYPAGVSGWGVATFASGHQQQSVRHLVGAQTWAGMQGLPHSLTASQPHSLTASQPHSLRHGWVEPGMTRLLEQMSYTTLDFAHAHHHPLCHCNCPLAFS